MINKYKLTNAMRKKMNVSIRQFMVDDVAIYGEMESEVLVTDVKAAFPRASAKQIAGNLSAVCCYFKSLNYNNGIVS